MEYNRVAQSVGLFFVWEVGYRFGVAGYSLPDGQSGLQVTGYRLQVTSYRLQVDLNDIYFLLIFALLIKEKNIFQYDTRRKSTTGKDE
jgi:hypothetical protein